MASFVWCELVCEVCSKTSEGQFTSGQTVPRVALKRAAKGWLCWGDKTFCSLPCLEEGQKDNG